MASLLDQPSPGLCIVRRRTSPRRWRAFAFIWGNASHGRFPVLPSRMSQVRPFSTGAPRLEVCISRSCGCTQLPGQLHVADAQPPRQTLCISCMLGRCYACYACRNGRHRRPCLTALLHLARCPHLSAPHQMWLILPRAHPPQGLLPNLLALYAGPPVFPGASGMALRLIAFYLSWMRKHFTKVGRRRAL